MDALLVALNGLGPWGIAIGAALVLVTQYLKIKVPVVNPNPSPDKPAPTPSPVPVPTPNAAPDRPILNALLKVLLASLAAKAVKENRTVEEVVAEHVTSVKE